MPFDEAAQFCPFGDLSACPVDRSVILDSKHIETMPDAIKNVHDVFEQEIYSLFVRRARLLGSEAVRLIVGLVFCAAEVDSEAGEAGVQAHSIPMCQHFGFSSNQRADPILL